MTEKDIEQAIREWAESKGKKVRTVTVGARMEAQGYGVAEHDAPVAYAEIELE